MPSRRYDGGSGSLIRYQSETDLSDSSLPCLSALSSFTFPLYHRSLRHPRSASNSSASYLARLALVSASSLPHGGVAGRALLLTQVYTVKSTSTSLPPSLTVNTSSRMVLVVVVVVSSEYATSIDTSFIGRRPTDETLRWAGLLWSQGLRSAIHNQTNHQSYSNPTAQPHLLTIYPRSLATA